MLRNFRLKKGQNKGIGLLELMLSLAIIAILLIMATRYYVSTETSQKVQNAVEMTTAIRGAVKNYLVGAPISTSVTLADLVSAGLLPDNFVTAKAGDDTDSEATNPWGKAITLAVGLSTITITMATPSKDTCTQLAQQVAATQGSTQGESASCGSTGTTMTAIYLR